MESHRDGLYDALFPGSIVDFKYGMTPAKVQELLVGIKCGVRGGQVVEDGGWRKKVGRMGKKIGELVRNMYYEVWGKYGDMLGEREMAFADRLEEVYKMTVYQLKKAAP